MQKVKRASTKVTRVLVMSDMHCGHFSGLTHPDYNPQYGDAEDKQKRSRRVRQGQQRKILYDWWKANTDAFQPFDVVLVNGDSIDGRGKKSGGTELISSDLDEQVEMAAAILNEVRKHAALYMTYGTPYHTGESEDFEDILAREVKAQKIEGEGHYDIKGLKFAMKHHIGNTRSPASRYTALSQAQLRQQLWALREQQPKADVIIRSHVHRCGYVGEPGTSSFAITTPGLQGLGSKFGIRRCDGLPVEFGFVVFDVVDRSNWSCMPTIASLSLQATRVTKI